MELTTVYWDEVAGCQKERSCTDEEVAEIMARRNAVPALPTAKEIEAAIQSSLDTFAQSWGYNDIASACTYVGDPCAKFNNEATLLRQWRSDTWLTVESVDAQIAAGTQPYPQTIEAAMALLPTAPARPA